MRGTSALSLLLALVFGTIAAFLARGLVSGGSVAPPQPERVVVAVGPIPAGTAVTADNLREIAWPAGTKLEGSFNSIASLTRDGRRLSLVSLQRNEPILATKVTAPNQRATLSTQLDDGMRAVSVRVDEVRGVAGFILPGDRVDIILTRGEGGAQDGAYADILIQNAKVLAIDQLASELQDKPTIARAVTLELGAEQAQKVVLAQGIGRLSLVLRQNGAADDDRSGRVTAADLGPGALAARDRIADLTAQVEALKQAAEQASARNGEGTRQQLAEMEMRLRMELGKQPTAALGPAAPPIPKLTINVIRNGSKREPYAVESEE